jgi:exonuclease I
VGDAHGACHAPHEAGRAVRVFKDILREFESVLRWIDLTDFPPLIFISQFFGLVRHDLVLWPWLGRSNTLLAKLLCFHTVNAIGRV